MLGRHGGRLSPAFAFDAFAFDPVSEAQRKAMFAAANGRSTLGIPKSVGEEFVGRGRHNGRASDKAGTRDFDADDATPEQIAKVRALYERPGTEGERQAAAAGLRRYGVDPDSFAKPSSSQEPPRRQQTPPRQTGPKRYHVVLQYTWNNKTLYDSKDVGATDEIDAERKVREHLAWSWKLTVGGKPPEFRHYKTTRI
jgi:hypothetical protein